MAPQVCGRSQAQAALCLLLYFCLEPSILTHSALLELTRQHTIFQGAPNPNLGSYNDWQTFSSKVSCH